MKDYFSLKFGILAFPASHSKSPEIYQAAFRELKIEATFERYEIPPVELEKFFTENFRKARKIDGLSVSIPHKEAVLPLLDEIDETAQEIGAVNTIFWKEGKLLGTNTDAFGFSAALSEQYAVEGKKVLVLGSGGAARAIIFALKQDRVEQIIIANRTPEKAEELALYFQVQWKKMEALYPEEYELVINTTALGMTGENEHISPIAKEFWRSHLTAFDIVYRPKETRFLQEAKTAGAQTISGEKMFLFQALQQFEILTGREAPQEAMERALSF